MSEKAGAIAPSKIAITKMLVEIESTRKHATRRWQLALIVPFVVGLALIGFTAREVRKNLKERDQLVSQKIKLEDDIVQLETKKAELTAANDNKALTIQRIENVVQESEKKGIEVKSLERIRNIIGPSQTVEKATPHVLIHIHIEDRQTNAAQVIQTLKSAGYVVPEIERTTEKVKTNEVRFFSQEERETAQRVADILTKQGVKDVRLVLPREHSARDGRIEVWLTTTSPPVTETRGERIELVQRGEVTIVRPHGQLTAENASDFRSLLARLRQQEHRKFLIDLGGVSKIDEQGLRALVSEFTTTNREGGQMEVINPTGVTDPLTIKKLRVVFHLHNNQEEAIRSFKR